MKEETKDEFKKGDQKNNLTVGFNAMQTFRKKMKSLLCPKVYCMAMKIYAYYAHHQFNLM
jgi:hypothetical protein